MEIIQFRNHFIPLESIVMVEKVEDIPNNKMVIKLFMLGGTNLTLISYHLGKDDTKSYSLTKNLLNYIVNALSNRKINYVVIK